MKHFIPKSAVVLFIAFLCSSVATAGNHKSCHFAFGSGVTEQDATQPGSPNIGPIRLRIGPVVLDGTVDVLVTDGFNVFAPNMINGGGRITGLAKGTFNFGDLGEFYTWEVDTVTFVGPPLDVGPPPKWATSELHGFIRSGPARNANPYIPAAWGTVFFANTDAALTGLGWNRFNVVNQYGVLVNEFTYFVWGKILRC